MPTPIVIKKHRTWCKRCLDFTIHKWLKIDTENNLCCEYCENEYTGYSLKDIPEDKIQQQRARYKEMKRRNFEKMLSNYSNPFSQKNNILAQMFSEPSNPFEYELIEDDAGQKYIDDKEKEKSEKAKQLWEEMKQDYNDNYLKVNNNDKCPCGSGLKYKKCHLIHWRKYEIAEN